MATRERVQTFDNETLAPLRRRPATNAPYTVSDAAVAARTFHPGTASFDAVSKFRRAVGDEQALPTLEAFAVDRLRKMALREDGTLDPNRLESFRRAHSDALRPSRNWTPVSRTLAVPPRPWPKSPRNSGERSRMPRKGHSGGSSTSTARMT